MTESIECVVGAQIRKLGSLSGLSRSICQGRGEGDVMGYNIRIRPTYDTSCVIVFVPRTWIAVGLRVKYKPVIRSGHSGSVNTTTCGTLGGTTALEE
ncbi:hypothetical protein J6590_069770 [Homalodisca vitripennis]|nr:hypothetical protein J6590_069770 [Homalodisca vitripennis]